jgi:hypothetical protein
MARQMFAELIDGQTTETLDVILLRAEEADYGRIRQVFARTVQRLPDKQPFVSRLGSCQQF